MLKAALALMLIGLNLNTVPDTYNVYKDLNRSPAVCEESYVLKGLYTEQSYSELETKTAQQDVYVTYFDEGDELPTAFITLCDIKGKLPLLVMRANACSGEYLSRVTAMLAQYNEPMLFELECNSKDFFRQAADMIHSKAPSVSVVWGISSDETYKLSTLYVGDFYADWVALNLDVTGDGNGLVYDPYPLYNVLSYFEGSKPIMINLSVASYGRDGHRYYSYDAAGVIEYVYGLADKGEAIKAVNYISKSTDEWDFSLTLSDRVMSAFSKACRTCKGTQGVRIPVTAYKYGNSFYCEGGELATDSNSCVIDNTKYYKIVGAGKYRFVK
jgi:hypothetical protein